MKGEQMAMFNRAVYQKVVCYCHVKELLIMGHTWDNKMETLYYKKNHLKHIKYDSAGWIILFSKSDIDLLLDNKKFVVTNSIQDKKPLLYVVGKAHSKLLGSEFKYIGNWVPNVGGEGFTDMISSMIVAAKPAKVKLINYSVSSKDNEENEEVIATNAMEDRWKDPEDKTVHSGTASTNSMLPLTPIKNTRWIYKKGVLVEVTVKEPEIALYISDDSELKLPTGKENLVRRSY